MDAHSAWVMKILLVQTAFLGDVILSTAVIAAIRKIYPDSELWMMTTKAAAPLVEHDPELAGVIRFDKRGEYSGFGGIRKMAGELKEFGFDKAYSLHRSFRTSVLLYLSGIPERIGFKESKAHWLYTRSVNRHKGVHDVLRNLSLLQGDCALDQLSDDLRLFGVGTGSLPAKAKELVEGDSSYVVMAPGSVWLTKRWDWRQYRALAEKLLEEQRKVVFIGSKTDRALTEKVGEGLDALNFAGDLSLDETITLISRASLLVCNDSMPLHIGSALKVPTVAVFCATSPGFGFGPWKNRAIVVEKQGLYCKPCRRHGSMKCPTGTESCMRDVKAPEVLHAANTLLRAAV